MAFQIVFVEEPEPARGERAVGESVFLANLPVSPKVFAFFYPGHRAVDDAEAGLRDLGQRTGDNLFVNIGTAVDDDYHVAVERFGIASLPVVIVTAVSPLAESPDGETAFVRLDGAALFDDPDRLVQTVEELFNLFLGGHVAEAVRAGWVAEKKAALAAAAERVWGVIAPVLSWAARKDVKVEFATAKIEVTESGSG